MQNYMDDLIKEVKKKKIRLNEKDAGPGLKNAIDASDSKNNGKKIPNLTGKTQSNQESTKQNLLDLIRHKENSKEPELPEKIVEADKEVLEEQKKETPVVAPEEEVQEVSDEQLEFESSQKTLVEAYDDVKIYKVKGKSLLHYVIPVRRPTSTEKTIINTIKEAATRLITISPYKVRDINQKRNIYYQKVMDILENSPQLNIQKRRWGFYADSVVREMIGYGIIDPLVGDDNLEEIMVIGPKILVYVFHREYEMMTTNIVFFSDQEIVDLINRIARQVGRRVDISTPLLDARLPDGSRVNATIPPASVIGSTLTIRKFKKDPMTIIDMVTNNTLDLDIAAFLWVCVEGLGVKPANILISGGTGSGKTTLLNALAAFVQPQERIISIEDTAELNLPLKHWIRFEGRPPGLEGSGELTIDIMTKNSLRMRPDRIIVGEIRHAEAFSLFTAMNTGHDGMENPDSLIQLADGSIKELGGFCEQFFGKIPSKKINDFEVVNIEKKRPKILAINKLNLRQQTAKVKSVWKRECKKSFHLKMASGKEIKLSYDHPVFRLRNGFLEQVQSHECDKGDYLCTINSIYVRGKKFDENYAYFLGLLLGNGHLRKGIVSFTNKNKTLQKNFVNPTKKLFKKEAKIYKGQDGIMASRLFSTKLTKEIHEKFNVPFGNKTKIFDVPKQIELSDNKTIGAFLRGMFDADGRVSGIRKSVVLAASNQNTVKKVSLLLKRFGIESRINVQKTDGKNHYGPYYRIFISGKNNLKKFSEFVGFKHPKKTAVLRRITGFKENTNVDLIPDTGRIIKRIRKIIGITQKELSQKAGLGKTRTVINAYETNARTPSRNNLKKINQVLTEEFNSKIKELNGLDIKHVAKEILLEKTKKAIQISFKFAKQFATVQHFEKQSGFGKKILYYYLKKNVILEKTKKEALARAIVGLYNNKMAEMAKTRQIITHINSITSKNIRWEKIVEITKQDENTAYYDLTLDKFNTFVANGIVVSNCLGTVHANSAKETIIRVTSPPMNVPEVMLSGLDLIVVEHRLHDKKKGTIRRITDISEVSGVLDRKTKTVKVYEYDHVTDSVKRTKNEINFLKILEKFTGWSTERMNEEIEKRKKFLKKLADENKRSMKVVYLACQEFVQKESEEDEKNATLERTKKKN